MRCPGPIRLSTFGYDAVSDSDSFPGFKDFSGPAQPWQLV